MEQLLLADGWSERGAVSVRGRAFEEVSATQPKADESDRLLDADGIAARFETVLDTDPDERLEAAGEVADSLEGYFGAVLTTPAASYLVADGARSIPLFYDAAGTVVSDRGRRVRAERSGSRNPVTDAEFLATRYVTGPETVWEHVFAVQPGEVVRLATDSTADEAISRYTYREYWPTGDSEAGLAGESETGLAGDSETGLAGAADGSHRCGNARSRDDALAERNVKAHLESALERALDRLEAVAGPRPIVVPLSGGYDSRLLASALVERDREVIAFTFGRAGHPDVELSREIATRLGIQWEFREYTRADWREWYHGDAGQQYREWAFGGDALVFLAAWPAVTELLEAGRLPEDGIYCPGHTVATASERLPRFVGMDHDRTTADVGCGSVRTGSGSARAGEAGSGPVDRPLVEPTVDDLVDDVLDRHYRLWEPTDEGRREAFRERIRRGLLGGRNVDAVSSPETAAAAYERWEWRGRLSTFTNGDLRLYEDRDVDWWLPLWDPAYVRAWGQIPLARRHSKRLHAELAVDTYRRVTGISSERARLTDRTLPSIDRVLSAIRHTPERQCFEHGRTFEPPFLAPRSRWSEPGHHPLAWYGAVDEALCERVPATSLYAIRTLAETGRLDLADGNSWVPADSSLESATAGPHEGSGREFR